MFDIASFYINGELYKYCPSNKSWYVSQDLQVVWHSWLESRGVNSRRKYLVVITVFFPNELRLPQPHLFCGWSFSVLKFVCGGVGVVLGRTNSHQSSFSTKGGQGAGLRAGSC